MKRKRDTVLLVDDSELNRDYLSAMLSDEYDMVEAGSGSEAIEILGRSPCDVSVILLDLMMPDVSGYDVLAWLQEHAPGRPVPVIVISSVTEYAAIRRAYAMGAVEYFERPFSEDVIKQRIANVLKAHTELDAYKSGAQRERVYESLASIIKFHYDAARRSVELSSFGARLLSLPGEIIDPLDDPKVLPISRHEEILAIADRLRSSSVSEPDAYAKLQLLVKGELRWFQLVARARWDAAQVPCRYLGCTGVCVDIDMLERQVRHWTLDAMTDPLTGLLRPAHFEASVRQRLLDKPDRKYMFVFLDLDRFKQANDEHGHDFGDEVLRIVGRTLRDAVRAGDIVSRMGGDEFMAFLEYSQEPEIVLDRLFRALRQDYGGFPISMSIGASLTEVSGLDYDALRKHADDAMYAVKKRGRLGVEIYRGEISENP